MHIARILYQTKVVQKFASSFVVNCSKGESFGEKRSKKKGIVQP